MGKDDYFVIAYKVLSHLYNCLKQGKPPNESYLQPYTKDFPIEDSYWYYVLEKLQESGYIEGAAVISLNGTNPIVRVTELLRITPNGIEYLQENGMMKKAAKVIKNIIETIK